MKPFKLKTKLYLSSFLLLAGIYAYTESCKGQNTKHEVIDDKNATSVPDPKPKTPSPHPDPAPTTGDSGAPHPAVAFTTLSADQQDETVTNFEGLVNLIKSYAERAKELFLGTIQTVSPVQNIELWCKYASPYGFPFQMAATDGSKNKIIFPANTNKDRYFWGCPDRYNPNLLGECTAPLSSDRWIYSSLFFVVNNNNTSPSNDGTITPSEFKQKAVDACTRTTQYPEGYTYMEYGIRSPNDMQPLFWHKPFFTAIPSTPTAQSLPFTRVVMFGDSISDNGNFWNASGHTMLRWPYFMGRFSNGPTWIEHFVNRINENRDLGSQVDLYNYAVGGSGSSTSGFIYAFSDLALQVDQYTETMRFIKDNSTDPNAESGYHKTLHVVFSGTNDYFYITDPNSYYISPIIEHPFFCNMALASAADCAKAVVDGNLSDYPMIGSPGIRGNIKQILDAAGPGEMWFLIPLEPNLNLLPYYNPKFLWLELFYPAQLLPPRSHPEELDFSMLYVNMLYKAHNTYLMRMMQELHEEYKDRNNIHFITFDLNTVLSGFLDPNNQEAQAVLQQTGIQYKVLPCFAQGNPMDYLPSLRFCGKPEQYLFWDSVHPTTTAHCTIAELALKTMYKAVGSSYTPSYTKCHESPVKNPMYIFDL